MGSAPTGISAAVREFRLRTGLTQAVIASGLGLSKWHISRIERGGSLSVAALRRLAAMMDAAGGASDLALQVRRALALTAHDFKSLDWRMRQLERRMDGLEHGRETA
jgi:transcriptional regulator with XRE-family HTH domain